MTPPPLAEGFRWKKRSDLTTMNPPPPGEVRVVANENGQLFQLQDDGTLEPIGTGTATFYSIFNEVTNPDDVPLPPPGQVYIYYYTGDIYILDSDGGTTVIGSGGGLSDGDYTDVTVSGTGTVITINNGVVTYAKMQDVSETSRVLGRITSGAGVVEELTGANVRTITGLATTDSPEFAGINLGHASDTTLTRTGAGDIAVEGNAVYRAGGTDVPVADGGTGASTASGARTNLSAAALSQTTECIAGFIASPSDKTYKLVVKMPHGGTITETTTISVSGTCTATFKINSTALGGTANSVSSGEQSQTHSGTNTFSAGDDIQLTVSSNSSCADMSWSIKYTRTLE